MGVRRWCAAALGGAVLSTAAPAFARDLYSHIVVVIEENTSFSQVIGNQLDAPYINTLAAGGVSFNQMYAITHPSQPNYLQFFSGGDQGKKDNTTVSGIPAGDNLGAILVNSGRTFVGYSESMPSVGFTGSSFTTVTGQGQYERKHNPWVNWQASSPVPGSNQLTPATNQPFTSFPTTAAGFAALPNVAIVVPNLQHDMHDGTIRQADDWLAANLSDYAAWAKENNSLLIVTFDEDNSASNNRIPTVMYGAGLVNGTAVQSTYTLHNLVQTIATWNGVTGPGLGAKTKVMTGPLASLGTPTVRTFQQNVGGYTGTLTNNIKAASPGAALTGGASLVIDGGMGTEPTQVLIRFNNLFGDGAAQVPAGARVVSAKLIFTTDTAASNPFSVDSFRLYKMVQSWSASSSWSSFGGNGVNADGVEAEAAAGFDFEVLPYATANPWGIFDVTDTLQDWSNGGANNGWVLTNANGSDGWRVLGETGSVAPRLEVTFALLPEPVNLPEAGTAGVLGLGAAGLLGRRWRRPAGKKVGFFGKFAGF